jgi:uncharacterized protein DUF5666
MRTYRFGVAVVCLSAVLAAAACGDSKVSNPAQPSPASAASAPTSSVAGASIAGTVMGVSGSASAPFAARATGMTVTVTGTNVASPVDDAGRFTLRGVPSGHVELHFSGRNADARLSLENVAEHEAIEIVVRVTGATAELEDNHRQTPDNRVEVDGIVSAVNAGAGTLMVGSTTVSVPATATIRHGNTALHLADIQVGDRVEIKGTMNGTTTMATEVQVETEHNANNQVEIDGIVAAVNAGAGTLTVGSTTVTVPASATIRHGSTTLHLTDIHVGDRVEIKATVTGTTTMATEIQVETEHGGDDNGTPGGDHGTPGGDDHGGGEAELSGTVAGKGGSCPSISFTVNSTSVSTNGSTEFKDVSCTALANGNRVEVKGTKQSNGSVMASRVEKK